MNLYLITHEGSGYDMYQGHVIAAKTAPEARQIAKDIAADEGKDVWDTAMVKELAREVDQREGIILSDFNAG